MNYKEILDKLDRIAYSGTTLIEKGKYEPAWNVTVMLREIQRLIRTIQDEINKEQESK